MCGTSCLILLEYIVYSALRDSQFVFCLLNHTARYNYEYIIFRDVFLYSSSYFYEMAGLLKEKRIGGKQKPGDS